MKSEFDTLFETAIVDKTVVEEKNNPDLKNYSGLPDPFTEVTIKADAVNHPYVKSKPKEFQDMVKRYATESQGKDKKYRILISAVNAIRNGMEFSQNQMGPIGHMVSLVEQEGPVTKGQFTLPLDTLEIENASWNAMQAPIPDSWKYDRLKHRSFAQVFDDYNKGVQPHGTLKTPQTSGDKK